MQMTLISNGKLRMHDPSGFTQEIGAEHPDFVRLLMQHHQSAKRKMSRARVFGLLMVAIGVVGWWYNWHLAATEGQFYIKLSVLGPLGLFGGLLMLLRPEWAGPLRSDSTRAHKTAMIAVIGLMAVASGIDMYFHLRHNRSQARPVIAWSPALGTPALGTPLKNFASDITFLEKTYHLGAFNRKNNDMWEFVTGNETVDNWTSLFTIIDRPDVRTREELDRLAAGIMSNYKARNGQILTAKTMVHRSEGAFNYIAVAFEDPARNRYELSFAKIALAGKNAYVVVFGVRIIDPDYVRKAKAFLSQHSAEIGHALENTALPEISALPRQEF